jgi:hypothetical protein
MHALRYLVSRGPPGTSQVVQRNGTPKVVFGSVISVWPSRPTVLMLSSVKYASASIHRVNRGPSGRVNAKGAL